MSKKVREQIVSQIIEALDRGVVPWRRPWKLGGSMPRNLSSGEPYKGINALILSAVAAAKGYDSSFWLTGRQLEYRRGRPKSGVRPTMIVKPMFWNPDTGELLPSKPKEGEPREVPVRDEKGRVIDGETVTVVTVLADENWVPVQRLSYVYNASACLGIENAKSLRAERELTRAEEEKFEQLTDGRCEGVLAIAAKHTCPMVEGGDRAFYSPAEDMVHMPHRRQFQSLPEFYHTAFHEYTHATGHPERLKRLDAERKGDALYAFEELTAELGACMLSNETGVIDRIGFDNPASYIASWKSRLAEDPKLLFDASKQSGRAIEWIKMGPPHLRQDLSEEDRMLRSLIMTDRANGGGLFWRVHKNVSGGFTIEASQSPDGPFVSADTTGLKSSGDARERALDIAFRRRIDNTITPMLGEEVEAPAPVVELPVPAPEAPAGAIVHGGPAAPAVPDRPDEFEGPEPAVRIVYQYIERDGSYGAQKSVTLASDGLIGEDVLMRLFDSTDLDNDGAFNPHQVGLEPAGGEQGWHMHILVEAQDLSATPTDTRPLSSFIDSWESAARGGRGWNMEQGPAVRQTASVRPSPVESRGGQSRGARV